MIKGWGQYLLEMVVLRKLNADTLKLIKWPEMASKPTVDIHTWWPGPVWTFTGPFCDLDFGLNPKIRVKTAISRVFEMAVFILILGFRPKLRSQKGHENTQNGPGYQVWMSTGGLEAISGHFITFKVSAFNFLKTTGWKRYWPHPLKNEIWKMKLEKWNLKN